MEQPAVPQWAEQAEIKDLLIRERYYRDTFQWDRLRHCYHPDEAKTNIKITWFHGNADDFVSGSAKMAAGGAAPSHQITPVLTHIHGKYAVSESLCQIMSRLEHDGTEYDLVSHARLVSRLEKVGPEWKIMTLEALYERDALHPVLPETGKPVQIPGGCRESYKCLAWVLALKGFSVDQQLPGVDVHGSIESVVASNLKWLRTNRDQEAQ